MRLVFSAFIAFVFVLFSSVNTSAQGVQDFVINDFKATYTLTNEDPQGLLTVTEQIELDYSGQNQGILRALPDEYKGNDLNLDVISIERDGEIEPYITYHENGNTVIRIGEAGTFITGEHSYVLNYQVENVVTFYDQYDEFFWDVNGDQWLQPFEAVSVGLTTGATRYEELQPQCFTGAFGQSTELCEVNEQTNGMDAATTGTLGPGETLTVLQAYEKGYFTPMSWAERNRALLFAAPLVLLQFAIVDSARRTWRRFGKDYKQRPVAPFFGRPKNVSVMQAAYVAKNSLTSKDVSAAIIDLAIRGYIKVVETKDGRKIKHALVQLKEVDSKLTADENLLLKGLFPDPLIDEPKRKDDSFIDTLLKSERSDGTFVIEDNKHKMSSTMASLSKKLESGANKRGFYELSPSQGGKKLVKQILFTVTLIVIGFFVIEFATPLPLITSIGSLLVVLVYTALMTKRSQSGVVLKEHVDGLKLYLGKAEKDRLEMHDAVAAPLSTRGKPPTYDRKFFEKLLPFAIAAGVEKSWAKAFADIYSNPPEWYQGTNRILAADALADSVGSTVKATSQTFTAPSSSGGSGFSGGSAGGGGGGGGGGGW